MEFLQRLLQAAQHDPAIDILGIGLGDFLVLLDGLLHHVGIDLIVLRITDQMGVDARQKAARIQIVGVLLESVFGVQHRFAQPAGLDIQIGKFLGDERRAGIGFQCGAITLRRLTEVFATIAVGRRQFRVQVSKRIIVVGRCFVDLRRRAAREVAGRRELAGRRPPRRLTGDRGGLPTGELGSSKKALFPYLDRLRRRSKDRRTRLQYNPEVGKWSRMALD